MYLHNATTMDEIATYGTIPLVEFLDVFEEKYLNNAYMDAGGQVFWQEIRAKALGTHDAIERVGRAEVGRKR